MVDLRAALMEFWGSFTDRQTGRLIPCFQDVAVTAMHNLERPQPPPFPYISYELLRPEMFGNNILSASIWDRRNVPGFMGLIDDVLRQAELKIPETGTILKWDTGAVWMRRNAFNFLSYLDEPNDPLVTRGVIRYELWSYQL